MAEPTQRKSAVQRSSRFLPATFQSLYIKHVQRHVHEASFTTLHYAYFVTTCLIAAIVFWGSATPFHSVRFIDALFLAVSAMTEAGLNTINLSELNTWQQVMLFILILMGSAIFVSSAVLHIRKSTFEKKLEELAERRRSKLLKPRVMMFSLSKRRGSGTGGGPREEAIASGVVRGRVIKDPDPSKEYQASFEPPRRAKTEEDAFNQTMDNDRTANDQPSNGHIRFGEDVRLAPVHASSPTTTQLRRTHSRILSSGGVGTHGMASHPRHAQRMTFEKDDGESALVDDEPEIRPVSRMDKYLDTDNGFIGRNSQFHHLSEKERRKLGGIEYDAISLLSWIVPIYFVLWQLLGAIGMGVWLASNRPGVARSNGLNPFWTGAFFAVSAFNNSGMALLDANAVALQTSYYALLTLSLLILAGNTCFPPFLRLILWTMKKCIPKSSQSPQHQKWRRILTFILDHPRRVYTNLFPSSHTWWLVLSLVLLNGIDWIAFEILNINNPVTEAIPPHFRALDGLFQAFAVRSGGFYVVPISALNPGILVLYVVMMYVSAYPVSITIRNTNVYEERSLGLYAADAEESAASTASPEDEKKNNNNNNNNNRNILSHIKRTMTMTHSGPGSKQSGPSWTRQDFVRQQLRGQLGHDLWWLALAIFLIAIIETSQERRDPVVFSIFNIIFEIVSAYGCVGISTGVPWNAYSFCGAWHTGSKLVLIAVMLRGRHRGLPVAIDRAILLPDESLAWAEEEDAMKRTATRERSRSRNRNPVRRGSGASAMV